MRIRYEIDPLDYAVLVVRRTSTRAGSLTPLADNILLNRVTQIQMTWLREKLGLR